MGTEHTCWAVRVSRDTRNIQYGRPACRRSLDEAEVEKSKVSERLLDAQHEILHLKSSLEVRPHAALCAATSFCNPVHCFHASSCTDSNSLSPPMSTWGMVKGPAAAEVSVGCPTREGRGGGFPG